MGKEVENVHHVLEPDFPSTKQDHTHTHAMLLNPHQPLSNASFNPLVGQPLAGMEPKARCVAGQPAILSARAAALILLLGAPPILFLDSSRYNKPTR